MEPAPTILTARLRLRQLTLDDAAALHPMLADSETMTWWSRAATASLEETRDYLAWNASLDPGHRCWAITMDGNCALGWVVVIVRRHGVGEIGYILSREAQGHGLAREAVAGVISHVFANGWMRRLSADVDPDNLASIRLLVNLGFRREGLLREEWETHLGLRDSLMFGLLAREWQAPVDMIS